MSLFVTCYLRGVMLRLDEIHLKPGLHSMHTRPYAECRRSCLYFCRRLRPAHTRCWTSKASADPRWHSRQSKKKDPRSPRADTLFCIGMYADVYRRIRSLAYTFIHDAPCAMQWRSTGRRKCGYWRRLPAHTGAWASFQIRKIAGCACAGNAGNVFPATAG